MIENRTSIRARYADTDKMGIVYYARYLEWFEVGRTELLRALGLPYTEIEKEGIILPVIEAYCKYRKPARYDQQIEIVSRVERMPRSTIRIDYVLYDEEGDLLASGYTVHTFLRDNSKPVRPPARMLEKMKPYFAEDAPDA